jgi:hypothetical protein
MSYQVIQEFIPSKEDVGLKVELKFGDTITEVSRTHFECWHGTVLTSDGKKRQGYFPGKCVAINPNFPLQTRRTVTAESDSKDDLSSPMKAIYLAIPSSRISEYSFLLFQSRLTFSNSFF